jgi:hypothetical protein
MTYQLAEGISDTRALTFCERHEKLFTGRTSEDIGELEILLVIAQLRL